MSEKAKQHATLQSMDEQELEFPDTTFIRDVESRVFQAITLQCLAKIEGISLMGGNLFDNLLGREGLDRIKGIYIEQDQKNHSVYIRVEVNIQYGIEIPKKSEEIQSKIVEEVTSYTGLHVSCVHVIFKNLIIPIPEPTKEQIEQEKQLRELEDVSDAKDFGEGF